MKWICYILSAWVLVLSCLPCADESIAAYKTQTNSNEVANFNNQQPHDHQNCTDFCSPFCICSCCGSTTLTHFLFFDFPIKMIVKETLTSFYKLSPFSDYASAHWQPPRFI